MPPGSVGHNLSAQFGKALPGPGVLTTSTWYSDRWLAPRHRDVGKHQRIAKLIRTARDNSPYVGPDLETFGEKCGRSGESGLLVDILVAENGNHHLDIGATVRQRAFGAMRGMIAQ